MDQLSINSKQNKEEEKVKIKDEKNKENEKEEEDIYSSDHILKEQEIARKKRQSVYQTSHSMLLSASARNELPKISRFSYFTSSLKSSIIGINEEEADQLLRVDECDLELSNQDVILAKPGWLIKKTWKVKNLGIKAWPTDTKIVSVTDDLYFYQPDITYFLSPGEVMEIGVRIYIPKEERSNDIKEYVIRLYSKELNCYGEPMVATVQLDSELYDQTLNSLPEDSIDKIYPRATCEKKYVENYEIAMGLDENKKESFNKAIRQLERQNFN